MLLLALLLSGCASKRAVSINWDKDVIKVGPGVTGKAYIWNNAAQQFELSQNEIEYPEGAVVTVVRDLPTPPAETWWSRVRKGIW